MLSNIITTILSNYKLTRSFQVLRIRPALKIAYVRQWYCDIYNISKINVYLSYVYV